MSADLLILDFIQGTFRTDAFDSVFALFTHMGDKGVVWVALTLIFLLFPQTRRIGLCMFVALVLDVFCLNLVLKPLVARPRPFIVNDAVSLFIAAPSGFSFPSGHSGASFAVACGMAFAGAPKRWWVPAVCLAFLIAFSRMYFYVHYPSDVLAGAVIGVLSGFLSVRIVLYFIKRRNGGNTGTSEVL